MPGGNSDSRHGPIETYQKMSEKRQSKDSVILQGVPQNSLFHRREYKSYIRCVRRLGKTEERMVSHDVCRNENHEGLTVGRY